MTTFLKKKNALNWSKQVGQQGDSSQRYIVKPFIVACLRALFRKSAPSQFESQGIGPRQPSSISSNFDGLFDSFKAHESPPDSVDKWMISALNELNIENINILDIGAGESYIGRWLTQYGANYYSIDVSQHLVNESINKLNECTEEQKSRFGIAYNDILLGSKKDYSIINWLNEAKIIHQGEKCATFISDVVGRVDIIICTNVLDQIDDIDVVMQHMRKLGDEAGRDIPLIVTTLNSPFFDTEFASRISDDIEPQNITVGKKPHTFEDIVHFRSPYLYEYMLRSNYIDIIDALINTPVLPFLRPDYDEYEDSAFKGNSYFSPFNCWFLLLKSREKVSEKTNLSPSSYRNESYVNFLKYLSIGFSSAHIYKFAPNQIVSYAHSAPHSVFFVKRGSARMVLRNHSEVNFRPGDVVGDLESSNRTIANRIPYPVVAGEDGCHMWGVKFSELGQGDEDDLVRGPAVDLDPQSERLMVLAQLWRSLFKDFRDRIAAHYVLFHRSNEVQADLWRLIVKTPDKKPISKDEHGKKKSGSPLPLAALYSKDGIQFGDSYVADYCARKLAGEYTQGRQPPSPIKLPSRPLNIDKVSIVARTALYTISKRSNYPFVSNPYYPGGFMDISEFARISEFQRTRQHEADLMSALHYLHDIGIITAFHVDAINSTSNTKIKHWYNRKLNAVIFRSWLSNMISKMRKEDISASNSRIASPDTDALSKHFFSIMGPNYGGNISLTMLLDDKVGPPLIKHTMGSLIRDIMRKSTFESNDSFFDKMLPIASDTMIKLIEIAYILNERIFSHENDNNKISKRLRDDYNLGNVGLHYVQIEDIRALRRIALGPHDSTVNVIRAAHYSHPYLGNPTIAKILEDLPAGDLKQKQTAFERTMLQCFAVWKETNIRDIETARLKHFLRGFCANTEAIMRSNISLSEVIRP